MKKTSSVIVILCIGAINTDLLAKPAKNEAVDYLALFSGACLRNMHAPEFIKTFAELQKWKPVSENLSRGGAPQAGKMVGSWVAKFDGQTGLLAVAKAKGPSEPVWTCTLMGKMVKPVLLLDELKSRFKTKKLSELVEGFQRYRFYSISVDGNRYTVSFINGEHPQVRDTFNISVTTTKF